MSRAIASARQRRAGITQEPLSTPSQTSSQPNGLTLPQVIALVDSRLIKLEQFMNASDGPRFSQVEIRDSNDVDTEQIDLNNILDDYNNRFILLAEEIALLKDTVMKLQTFTMNVNKVLLEDRGIVEPITDEQVFVMNSSENVE